MTVRILGRRKKFRRRRSGFVELHGRVRDQGLR
jgi:hypothetical protein